MTLPAEQMTDAPRFVPVQDYDRCVDRYVRAVRGREGVLAVYQMGGVSSPGLSDLDLIVVVDGTFRGHAYHDLSVRRVLGEADAAPYLFIHDVMVIDVDSFRRLAFINYASDLRLLWGEPLEVDPLTPDEERFVKLAILCDFTLMRLHQFEAFSQHRVFPIRGHIVRGSSVKHSIALADFMGRWPEHDRLCRRIDALRRHWFDAEDLDEARAVFAASVEAFRDLLIRAAAYLRDEVVLYSERDITQHVLMLNDFSSTTLFVERATFMDFYRADRREDAYRGFARLLPANKTMVPCPHHVYFQYLTYARTQDNDVSRVLQRKLSNAQVAFEAAVSYRQAMQKRCEAITRYNAFLQEHHIHFSNGVGFPGINLLRY